MPAPYPLNPEVLERLFPKSVAEKIIGSQEAARATKTYMPNTRMVVLLARVANHYQRVLWDFRRLAMAQGATGDALRPEVLEERYPAIRTWKRFHEWVIEHISSLEGFSTKAAVRAEMLRQDEEGRLSSATRPREDGGKPAARQDGNGTL